MNEFDKVLVIGVAGDNIFLVLKNENGDQFFDREKWQNDGSSSEQLLRRVDVFLDKNDLKVNELLKVEMEIDERQKYTLARIIETIVGTINYCLKSGKSNF